MTTTDQHDDSPLPSSSADDRYSGLERRYRIERDRRVRPERTAEFVDTSGRLAHYRTDPLADASAARLPLTDTVDVIVVGGGFAGLMSAAALRREGVDNFRLIESGTDFGGVWYWNRYPGVFCDVESYIYLPFLEETGYVPTEKYVKAHEIRAHFERMARHFRLYENACFQTRTTHIEWNEEDTLWIVTTNRGDRMKARFIVLGTGALSHPKLPPIPGIDTFKGSIFHTSRWDYDFTGGDYSGNLSRLRDKRVAIIGTGATAIQAVPHLGEWAEKLYVVQRTPAIVARRDNRPTDPEWMKSLKPGWQKRRIENFDGILAGVVKDEDLVGDAWTDIWGAIDFTQHGTEAEPQEIARRIDFEKLEAIRARVDSIVEDPETAEALKPYYYRFCKRPCFHDEYLQTFNLPNVQLIDTRGQGLDCITDDAIVFDGNAHKVDCIICATGFDIGVFTQDDGGFKLIGRDGVSIDEKWSRGARTLHGLYTNGFPNLFFVSNPHQSKTTNNYPYMLGERAEHSAKIIKRMLTKGLVMDIRTTAEDRWAQVIQDKSKFDSQYMRACTPSYFNEKSDDSSLLAVAYGGSPFEYIEELSSWRDGNPDDDLELGTAN